MLIARFCATYSGLKYWVSLRRISLVERNVVVFSAAYASMG